MAPCDGGEVSGDKSGYLEIEYNGVYYRRYCNLQSKRKLLLVYEDNPKNLPPGANPLRTINLRYVSVVRTSSTFSKPKCDNSFVIEVTGKPTNFRAADLASMEMWVDALNAECRINVPRKVVQQKSSDEGESSVGYQVTIVGGVPLKTKIETEEDSGSSSDSEIEGGFSTPASFIRKADHIILQGYAVKQGVMRKSWKRRFFVLDNKGISYYKSEEDLKPIKIIMKDMIVEARRSVGIYPTRECLTEIVTKDRVFYIEFPSEKNMWEWIHAINRMISRRSILTKGPAVTDESSLPVLSSVQNASCQTGNSLDRNTVKRLSLPASWCA